MRNANEQDVENLKKGVYPKNVMFAFTSKVFGYGGTLFHIKFDINGNPLVQYYVTGTAVLVEYADSSDVSFMHLENFTVPRLYKGPATTPAKLKRKPKKGTKPMKTSDIEVGDYVVTRDRRFSSKVASFVNANTEIVVLESGEYVSLRPCGYYVSDLDIVKIIKAKKPVSVDISQAKLPQQFKVGDKVVMTENFSPYAKEGDIGVIQTVWDDFAIINFSSQKGQKFFEHGRWEAGYNRFKLFKEPQDTSEYIVWVNSDEFDCAILPDDHNPENPTAKNFKGTLEQAKEMVNSLSSTFGFEPYTIYKLVKVEPSK